MLVYARNQLVQRQNFRSFYQKLVRKELRNYYSKSLSCFRIWSEVILANCPSLELFRFTCESLRQAPSRFYHLSSHGRLWISTTQKRNTSRPMLEYEIFSFLQWVFLLILSYPQGKYPKCFRKSKLTAIWSSSRC